MCKLTHLLIGSIPGHHDHQDQDEDEVDVRHNVTDKLECGDEVVLMHG